jgi:hypothetical protein
MSGAHGACLSCECDLLQPHGFYGTDLCGPCCVGEAATRGQRTWHCIPCGFAEESAEVPRCSCGRPMTLDTKPGGPS